MKDSMANRNLNVDMICNEAMCMSMIMCSMAYMCCCERMPSKLNRLYKC